MGQGTKGTALVGIGHVLLALPAAHTGTVHNASARAPLPVLCVRKRTCTRASRGPGRRAGILGFRLCEGIVVFNCIADGLGLSRGTPAATCLAIGALLGVPACAAYIQARGALAVHTHTRKHGERRRGFCTRALHRQAHKPQRAAQQLRDFGWLVASVRGGLRGVASGPALLCRRQEGHGM